MSAIIVYTYEGHTIISNPAPGIDPQLIISRLPSEVIDATILTTDDLPPQSAYSEAWILNSGIIEVDITTAKQIHINILNNLIDTFLKTLFEFRSKVLAANKDPTTINTRINYLRTFTSDPRIAAATTVDELIPIEPVDWDFPAINDLPQEQYSNDPRITVQNIIKVKKNPGTGEFSTIIEALTSITDADVNNRYLIQIGPGIYIEPELNIPEYTTISGSSNNSVIVTPLIGDQSLFICSNYTEIEFITIAGHSDSLLCDREAIKCIDSGTVKLNNLIINEFNIGIRQKAINEFCILFCSHVNVCGNFLYGFHNTTSSLSYGNKSIMNLMNLDIYQTSTNTSIYSSGSTSELYIQSSSFTGLNGGPTGSKGIVVLSGIVDIVGSLFYDMQGIVTEESLDPLDIGPALKISGSIFNNCSLDFDIKNPNTTGYYIGYSIKDNYSIHADSIFFIANESSNVLTVSKAGSNFTSVKAALDSIVNSSETNIYTVVVGSGTYEEDEMTLPPYTSVMGTTINSTFIRCKTANQNLFNMGEYCELSFLTLEGHENSIGTGYAAIKCSNVGDFAQMHKLSIFGFDIGIDQLASTSKSMLYIEYVDVNESGLHDVRNVSQNGFEAFIQLENFYGYQSSSDSKISVLNDGSNTNMKLHVAGFIGGDGVGLTTQKGVVLQNGGHCDIGATFFQDLLCGVYIPSTGAGPNVQIEGTTFMTCGKDFNILNTSATGYFFGYSKRTSYNIVTGSAFFIADQDAKLIRVAKRGGDFTSIKAAVDSITDSSFYNPYMVMVGPGLYFEYEIQMKTGIFLMGTINGAVVIVPPIPTKTIIYGAEWSMVKDFVLSGAAGPGGRAIYHHGTAGDGFLVRDCAFTQNETNVHIHGTDVLTVCVVDRCITSGNVGYAHKCTNENGCPTRLTLLNLLYQDLVQPVCQYFAYCSGPGTTINAMNCMLNIVPTIGATGFKIEDGAQVNISGSSFKGFDKAIHVTSVGAAPKLYTSQTLIHDSVNYDIIIENEGTEGLFQGSTDYNKTLIHKDAPFHIYLKDQHVISVMKKGGDFRSIKTAIDSITDSDSNNRYVINVGAGVFLEQPITLKPFVYVIGSHNATKISPVTRNQHLIIGSNSSKISNVYLSGITNDTTESHAAIYYNEPLGTSSNIFLVEDVVFGYNDTNVIAENTEPDKYSTINLVNCRCGHGTQFNTGFLAISAVSSTSIININQLWCIEQSNPKPSYFVKAIGPSTIILNNIITKSEQITPTTYSKFAHLENGASLFMNSVTIDTWYTGIYVSDIGKPSKLNITGILSLNNTKDIDIQHEHATGFIDGCFTNDKIISVSTSVKMSINDVTNNGYTFSGPFNYSKNTYQNTIDISSLILDNSNLNVIEGGFLSQYSDNAISVTSGYGYLLNDGSGSDSNIVKYGWSFTTLSIPASSNTSVFIFMNNNGVISYDTLKPSSKNNLIFGSVFSSDTSIKNINSYFSDNSLNTKHIPNNISDYLYDIGPTYISGSIVNISPMTDIARSLSVSSGEYYYGSNKILVSSSNFLTWVPYYHSSGTFISSTTSSIVPNDTFDNGTDLISLTSGYYTRHLLMQSISMNSNDSLVNSPPFVLIHGQTQSVSNTNLENPQIPSFIIDSKSFLSIASIIVQEGSDTITFIDERPIIVKGNVSSGGSVYGGSITDHSNLTNLNQDDHPQYLLSNGTRSLTGNLNLNLNNIINATLINGIDIEGHASRHAFNGSDPLTPAIISDISELSDSVSYEGSNNTRIPRADHVHSHGNRGGGSLHSIVTTSVAGFMSYEDKIKLDTIETGATNTQLNDSVSPVIVNKGTASIGVSDSIARADHKHDISTAAPTSSLTGNSANSEGSSTSVSRADHSHAISTGVPITQSPDQTNATGTSSSLSRSDHIHEIKTASAVSLSGNTTNTVGAADSFSRSNHTHEILTGIPVIQTIVATASEGSSADLARADHIHTFETGVARTIGTTNNEGTALTFSRSDHIHAHGPQLGGTLHSVATTSVSGFMAYNDKVKLDSVASGATKNDYYYASGSSTYNFSGNTSNTISGMSLIPGAGSYLVIFNASVSSPSTSYLHTFSVFVNGSEVSSTIRFQNIHDTEILNINVVITNILVDQYVEMRVKSTGSGSVYNRSFTLMRI